MQEIKGSYLFRKIKAYISLFKVIYQNLKEKNINLKNQRIVMKTEIGISASTNSIINII